MTITPNINLLEHIRLATAYANTLSLWKNKCLVQSLAARLMLRRRSIESLLTLGVTHNIQKKVAAHAWLAVGDFELVAKSGDYHKLFSF